MAIPGLTLFADIANKPVRGQHVMGDLLYVVIGTRLYGVDQNGFATDVGEILGSNTVTMADNGFQLAICAAPYGYVLAGDVIVEPDGLPLVSDVEYIDSYFVWSIYNSDQCIYSGIADGVSYDALDVFTAEGSPDGIVGIIADHRELHLYGEKTVEIFYNSGGADNVFERQGNAFIERGCFDRDSIVKIDNSVQFLGDDRVVYRLEGYNPLRISTHAIEYRLRNATWARAFTYTQEGHKFYVLNTDQGTFAYDLATGTWAERKSWQLANYRIGGAVSAWGQALLSDAYTGRIYRPDLDVCDENGDPIVVEIGLPTLEASRERVTMYAFEVYCETGVGLSTGQGSDPQIMLKYSDNGGRTYSSELWRSLGQIGEYRTRAIWRNLGQFRQRNIQLTISDPVRRLVMGYYADVR
ncbi:packaged DNA stabilization protein [Sphingobium chungbukense]|nr:packaged DNA stabilization protein [Sphingobium chungbukense]